MSKKRLNTDWSIDQEIDYLKKRLEELADIQKTSDSKIEYLKVFIDGLYNHLSVIDKACAEIERLKDLHNSLALKVRSMQ
jgi:hypothetical protein